MLVLVEMSNGLMYLESVKTYQGNI